MKKKILQFMKGLIICEVHRKCFSDGYDIFVYFWKPIPKYQIARFEILNGERTIIKK